jgi:trehalose 6-phosphate phosphatase
MSGMDAVTEALLAAGKHGETLLLLFDFDGTLCPTVDQPRQAALPARTRQVLVRLSALPYCRVGAISSRSLEDLRARFDIPGVLLAGSGGMERLSDGRRLVEPEAESCGAVIETLVHSLEPMIDSLPGAWLERKPFGLTIHHRGAGHHTETAVRRLAAAVQSGATPCRVTICDLGVEIAPCAEIDKGTAVRAFVAQAAAEPLLVIYAGNDANDEEAMAEAVRCGGYAIGVGPSAPAAAQSLSGPEALTAWLEGLAAGLSA